MSQEYGYESTSISTETIETVISAKTCFKGNVKTENPIRIDGVYEGEIESTSLIIVTGTGSISGKVSCREMQLHGKGKGTLFCSQVLDIKAGAVYEGDVVTKNLVTVEGSVIDGTCSMLKFRE